MLTHFTAEPYVGEEACQTVFSGETQCGIVATHAVTYKGTRYLLCDFCAGPYLKPGPGMEAPPPAEPSWAGP